MKIDYELFQTNLTEQDVELFMNLTYQVLFVSWKVLIGSLTNDDDDDLSWKIRRRMFTSSIKRRIRWFHVVAVQWMSKKCTKKRDARAELFCSY